MRPSRTFLFLFSVIITLSLLSAFFTPWKWAGAFGLTSEEHPAALSVSAAANHSAVIPLKAAASVESNTIGIADTSAGISSHLLYSPSEAISDTISKGKQFRVLFYGDSQLEGDRMTSYLRRSLRDKSGGTGPGLFSPVMPVMYTRSIVIRSSSNWRRYTWLDYKHGRLDSNRFGPALSLCRFTPPGVRYSFPVSAWVRVTPSKTADKAVSAFDQLRIIYSNLNDTLKIRVMSGEVTIASDTIYPCSSEKEYRCSLNGSSDVKIEFTGRLSPDIYSMSIESPGGVVVDNIPLRGSAGLEFVMTDKGTFRQSMKILKPDLIILQYGLNVVRNVRKDYSYYEDGLVRQIQYLKDVSGGVPVLLISLTDMADMKGDSLRFFKNIPAIRDAQAEAARRTGILFWDAWKAMGGAGSISKWAKTNPPLAQTDLTHLSLAGSDTLAKKLINDLFIPGTQNRSTPVFLSDDTVGTKLISSLPDMPSVADTGTVSGYNRLHAVWRSIKGIVISFFSYNPSDPFIFTSPAFWVFLLIVLAGFSIVLKNNAVRNIWLLVVSFWFYFRAGGLFILLLIFISTINYFCGLLIFSSAKRTVRRIWLSVSIISGLGLLGYFKYAAFATDLVNSVFNTSFITHDYLSMLSNSILGTQFDVSSIILPVGISFFTFQALSYTIDIYRNKVSPVKRFTDFAFYVSFFPHLVAGPIVRASEFVPQMYTDYSLTRNEWGHALFLILQGLIKKMVISDFIAGGFVDRVFVSPSLYSGFENLLSVYGYGIQIYCDFSGYTDIAIGIALLMGFRLPVNFNSPYKAPDISDFWKRWHISLSRWLKDYLYIPLGGSRKGSFRTGMNLMITMTLGGLWHGASLRFVVWGAMHGVALVINKIWKRIFKGWKKGRKVPLALGVFLTFNFVNFTWIFFRTGSFDEAMEMIQRIFTAFDPGSYRSVIIAYLPSLLLILTGYTLHFVPYSVKESYRGIFIRMPVVLKFVIIACVCLLIHKVGLEATQPFIYFRF
jgi:alginate O-acetyltransferase complex protein AlgI